jgi:hypothetical protein
MKAYTKHWRRVRTTVGMTTVLMARVLGQNVDPTTVSAQTTLSGVSSVVQVDGSILQSQTATVSQIYSGSQTAFLYAPAADSAAVSLSLELPKAERAPGYMLAVELTFQLRVTLDGMLVAETGVTQTVDMRAAGAGSWSYPDGAGSSQFPSGSQLISLLGTSVSGGSGVGIRASSGWSPEQAVTLGDGLTPGNGQAATFGGGGTVTVGFSADMNTDGVESGYHNMTDAGPDSPYLFVNNPKVYSMYGASGYQFETQIQAVYTFLPENGGWAHAGAVLGVCLLAGIGRIRRSRNRRPENPL